MRDGIGVFPGSLYWVEPYISKLATQALADSGVDGKKDLLQGRHIRGDWGERDEVGKNQNMHAMYYGGEIVSAYSVVIVKKQFFLKFKKVKKILVVTRTSVETHSIILEEEYRSLL